MEKLIERFKHLFNERFKRISVLDIGEDSLRFDFYVAAQQVLGCEPWEMQLEHPIDKGAFVPRNHQKSKRNEKPKLDLWLSIPGKCIAVEFAIFKRNSVDGSRINDTENAFKHLNDMMRLALHSHFTKCEAYFVCLADAMMLNRRLKHGLLGPFPCPQYQFDANVLLTYSKGYKSAAAKVDSRFFGAFQTLNLQVDAELICDYKLDATTNKLETRIIIWRVTSKLKV